MNKEYFITLITNIIAMHQATNNAIHHLLGSIQAQPSKKKHTAMLCVRTSAKGDSIGYKI